MKGLSLTPHSVQPKQNYTLAPQPIELERSERKEPEKKADDGKAAAADEEPVIWHRVVAGSYRSPENARRQMEQLRAAGIDAFIVRHQI